MVLPFVAAALGLVMALSGAVPVDTARAPAGPDSATPVADSMELLFHVSATPVADRTVLIEGILPPYYNPANATAVQGGNITFLNNARDVHTATANSSAPEQFDTGLLPPRASKTVRLTVPGVYDYHCSIHPWMHASIVVVPLAPPNSTQNATAAQAVHRPQSPAPNYYIPAAAATAALVLLLGMVMAMRRGYNTVARLSFPMTPPSHFM